MSPNRQHANRLCPVILQKALNIFNAALVTPTYYVYFTSTTIITSAVLFQGFKGSAQEIVTVVLGFLTICSGVVLLQLSKAAKDVPDAAVFQGDLDQIHTIAEQEQPESEPKADAIRGTAGLVRRFSRARIRMEEDELRRLHEEKMMEAMQPISENGQPAPAEYEWDGLRRRRTTTFGSNRRPYTATTVSHRSQTRSQTSPMPPTTPSIHSPRSPHPPLGMSRFPDDYDEYQSQSEAHHDHDDRSTIFSSIAGSFIRGRGRSRTTTTMPAYDEEEARDSGMDKGGADASVYLEDVPPSRHMHQDHGGYYNYGGRGGDAGHHGRGGSIHTYDYAQPREAVPLYEQDTSYRGAAARARARQRAGSNVSGPSLPPPTPPPHLARRNFSFNKVFRKADASPTEEERAGLVVDDRDRAGGQEEDRGQGGHGAYV